MDVKGHACGLRLPNRLAQTSEQTMLPLQGIPLHDGWKFRQVGDDKAEWMPVSQFPTNVHLDLIYNKIIPDPFIANNEGDVQWVSERSWVYKKIFSSPPVLPGQKAVIVFEGLDTHAKVVLNGEKILQTEDMFIPQRIDVTKSLYRLVENVLEITFESTYLIGKKLATDDPKHKYGCWNGDPSRLTVRKAQYHYGWDWGPALLTCGPWRPVSLEIYTSCIADLFFSTHVDHSLQWAEITARCEVNGKADEALFEVVFQARKVMGAVVKVVDGFASASFRTQNPELWYPARYGEQPLYELKATILSEHHVCDTKSKRFGLRRAEVVQRGLRDAPGTSFFFRINGIPMFCGGSNWIPADSFIPRIKPSKYRDWIKLAVAGNQSMIRIWGGGIFEEQAFYNACDELGVLVWQDFLFACGNYPANEKYVRLVKCEATATVMSLRHHPCIVIWAGNNEDYQYAESEKLEYDPQDQIPDNWLKSNFPARYIYEKILLEVTQELVPDTCYHFGSPFGGTKTTDPTVGDIHQWNVWHGTQEGYQDWDKLCGRFVAEFGMEAFPSVKTVESYLPKGKDDPERYAQSSTIDFHNKGSGHARRLATYMVENIPYSHSPFEYYIYCTQLMQAECLATAFRLWKREWKGPGREYCSGALVWQLNDCWPTQSWSIVDYYLRPKLAYYAIKREMADVTINLKRVAEEVPAGEDGHVESKMIHKVQIFGTNLSLQSRGYHWYTQSWDIISGELRKSNRFNKSFIQLPSNQSTEIAEEYVGDRETAARTVFAAYMVDTSDSRSQMRAVSWPEPLRYVRFQKPKQFRMEIRDKAGADHEIELEAEIPMKGVALEVNDESGDEVVFDDNCTDLVPNETVAFRVKGLSGGEEDRITVRYLKAGIDL